MARKGLSSILAMVMLSMTVLKVATACNPESQFECNDGRCIPIYWRCDGTSQCDDGEDENDCGNVVCPANYPFKCQSGKCIPERSHCDAFLRQDCPDGDDQMNCPGGCNPEHQWQCQDTVCIYKHKRCDTVQDCPDGSDEEGCDEVGCADDEFKCNSGMCIPLSAKCDQYADCTDQEDEDNCPERECGPHEFRCDNSVCILGYLQCNGPEDCKNGEDEQCGASCNQCEGWSTFTNPRCNSNPRPNGGTQCGNEDHRCATLLKRNRGGKYKYRFTCKGPRHCTKNMPAGCYEDPVDISPGESCVFCCDGPLCNNLSNMKNIEGVDFV